MSSHRASGFTIIEVLLFLAITGALAAGLIGGWSVSVNTQSYRDSAYSLASKLQQQYTDTTDVHNDRNGDFGCKPTSDGQGTEVVENTDSGVSSNNLSSRGASDCVIMGKYILIDGERMTMKTIVGNEASANDDISQSESTIIKSYKPSVIDSKALPGSTYDIPWGSRPYAAKPEGKDTLHLAMVLVRSPLTGTTYTYQQNLGKTATPPSARDLIDPNNQAKVEICLAPSNTVASETLMVSIAANASSQNSVTQGGGGDKC